MQKNNDKDIEEIINKYIEAAKKRNMYDNIMKTLESQLKLVNTDTKKLKENE